ncbi:helix-turn-helix domain-containing protein [Cellulomonas endophytica]|uniref:helix-turn-helix domain-containing protein n=1 Tax=Cellulomonas endophytica TaxID=2494735 RepID=UPI0010113923|nr:helix-turn-helix transcriptional regulator [Cellulomonas endophytica]
MTRRLGYHWHLRRIMAAHDMWKTTDLAPLLRERGVNLSAAQVYRLVADKPERLSLHTLTALCDIFGCTPADLVEPYVESAGRKGTAEQTGHGAPVTELHTSLRPTRARIVDPERD